MKKNKLGIILIFIIIFTTLFNVQSTKGYSIQVNPVSNFSYYNRDSSIHITPNPKYEHKFDIHIDNVLDDNYYIRIINSKKQEVFTGIIHACKTGNNYSITLSENISQGKYKVMFTLPDHSIQTSQIEVKSFLNQ